MVRGLHFGLGDVALKWTTRSSADVGVWIVVCSVKPNDPPGKPAGFMTV